MRFWICVGVISVAIGLLSACLTSFTQTIPNSYFQVLAIVQASLLGIVIAIYVLSSQLAANQYSIRLLSVRQSDNTFTIIIGIFGLSILLNILGILSNSMISGLAASASVGITSSFAVGAFLSLYLIKNRLIERTQPETIADQIRDKVTSESLRSEIENPYSRPYFAYFEAGRAAIESGDNQAARQIVLALSSEITTSLNEILGSQSAIDDRITNASRQIIKDLENILEVLVKYENAVLIQEVAENIVTIGKTALSSKLDRVGSSVGDTLFKIGDSILLWDDVSSVSKFPWNAFSDLLATASKKQLEETIRALTLANTDLLLTIQENHTFERSFQMKIADILIEGYLDAWEIYIRNSSTQISSDDILIGDPKFMELGNFEYLYNYYEDGYRTVGQVVANLTNGTRALSPGSLGLAKTTIEGLSHLAIAAEEEGNEPLTKHLTKLTIMSGIGFNQLDSRFVNLSSEITDVRSSNSQAVDNAFTELQNLQDQENHLIRWHLSLLSYRYDDEDIIERFEDEVEHLKNDISS